MHIRTAINNKSNLAFAITAVFIYSHIYHLKEIKVHYKFQRI